MIDWDVRDDEVPLPPSPSRRPRRLALIRAVALGLVALLVGGLLMRQQLARVEAERRAELERFIFDEERVRAFGLSEQVTELIAPTAPEAWTGRYRARVAEVDEPRARRIEVREIEWHADGALAALLLEGEPQLRYYQRFDDGWRRSPIPDGLWGDTNEIALASGLVLSYRARDRGFATDLVARLGTLEGWLDEFDEPRPVSHIELIPLENARRAATTDDGVVTLVSPLLLDVRSYSPEEEVRLALAETMLAGLRPPLLRSRLPNAPIVSNGLVDHLIARWALRPTRIAVQLESARTRVSAQEWRSPFLFEAPDALALVAASLYEQGGAPLLIELLGRDEAGAHGWDDLLRPGTGKSLYELEARSLSAINNRAVDPPPAPRLTGRFVIEGDDLLYTSPTGPVVIDLEDNRVELGNGSELPVACAPYYPDLTAVGEWIEEGRRLRAERISTPSDVPVIAGPVGAGPRDLADVVRFDRLESDRRTAVIIETLDGTGTRRSLYHGEVEPLLQSDLSLSRSTTLLVAHRPKDCPLTYVFEFLPSREVGTVWAFDGLWRMGRLVVTERPDHGDWLLFSATPEERYDIYSLRPDYGGHGESVGSIPMAEPLGWDVATQSIVALRSNTLGIALYSLSGEQRRFISLRGRGIHWPQWDNESALYYVPAVSPGGGAPIVVRLGLGGDEPEFVYRHYPDRELMRMRLLNRPSESVPTLLLLDRDRAAPPSEPLRLLRVDLERGLEWVGALEPGHWITDAVACPDGSILFATVRFGSPAFDDLTGSQLHIWRRDRQPEAIGHSKDILWPLRCTRAPDPIS